MKETAKNYLPAIACALVPILCYAVVRPYAEIGINDDWSYIKTAQVLAQTGHLVYNGWGSPMLGWQAYVGALFIKFFGFSFTVVRFSTVIEAIAAIFLLQRTFLRAGVNRWNATLGTMTLALSPLCLPLDFTFMNDVPGLLVIVLCLYMCLRALQAKGERSAVAWLFAAVFFDVLGGTARQIAWLGALVMIPCAVWLMRRSSRILLWGCLSCVAGISSVLFLMRWAARQPYIVPESAIPGRIDLNSLRFAAGSGLEAAGLLALLAMPVLLMFVERLREWNRRSAAIFATGIFGFVILEIFSRVSGGKLVFLAPFLPDYMTDSTFQKACASANQSLHLSVGNRCFPILLTSLAVLGALSAVAYSFVGTRPRRGLERDTDSISWLRLGVLLIPFTLAYALLLISVALQFEFYDRHLLPLLAILLIVATRYYQESVRAKLPFLCVIMVALYGCFSTAAAHDEFSMYRGYAAAIKEAQSSGAPPTAILGWREYAGWAEIEKVGHINNPRIRDPKGAYLRPPARIFPVSCNPDLVQFLKNAPAIRPTYAVSLNPGECGGQVALPPVVYHTWLAPQKNAVYVVRLPRSFPQLN